MLKKLIAGLTALALSLGMVTLTATSASAHQGDITARAVCNPQTGNYDVTYTLSWSNVPAGVQAHVYTRTGAQGFQNGWGLGTWNDWTDWGLKNGPSGSVVWTTTFPGTTTGNGPWVYGYTAWSNGYGGSTHHDTRVEGLDGRCGTTVTPVAPTFTSAQCTGPGTYGDASYTVPSVTGVQYQKSPNGTNNWTDIDTGTYATAANSNVHLRAIAENGYTLSGNPQSYKWSKDFDAPNCTYDATPVAPTFTSAVCTGPGQNGSASYTIPTTVGVKYEVRFTSQGSGGWSEKTAGTYTIAADGYVEVRAVALPNYQLKNYPGTWKKQFQKPDCIVKVTPTMPTTTQAVCTGEGQVGGASFTIPSITGVQYQRWNGNAYVDIDAGVYPVADGTSVWIRAVDDPGYDLLGDDDDYVWKLQFDDVNSSKCVVPANPTPTQSQCTAPGQWSQAKYVIPNDTGIQYQIEVGANWVNIAAGSVDVNSFPTTIELRAIAKSGYTIVGGPYTWTFTFVTAGDCLVKVVPGDPTFTDSVCQPTTTGSTQGGYFIPTTPNVSYTVSLNSAAPVAATTGSFVPTSPLDHVVITAIPAAGYTLSGYTGPWSHTFADPGTCLDDATAAQALFVDAVCEPDDTGATTPTYEVVAASNVTYRVSTNGVDYAPIGVGTYDGVIGQTVYIEAVAAPGYRLVGYDGPWSHTFASPGDCLDEVAVGAVTKVDQTCIEQELDRGGKFGAIVMSGIGVFVSGWITIPTTPHVSYYLAPDFVTPLTAGDHPLPPGMYYVHAVADPGYVLTGYTEPFELVIEEAEPCGDLVDLPIVTPVVSFVDETCLAAGRYTLGVEQPGLEEGVIWTVTNGLPNTLGTHDVAAPLSVTITAVPAPGYGFPGEQPFREWTHVFPGADDCLPTLALTGGGVVAGGLGLSTLLVVGGILLIGSRQRTGRPGRP